MDLTIIVSAKGMHHSVSAGFTVTEPFVQAFEPLHTTDDSMMSFLLSQHMPRDAVVTRKLKLRKEAAKELSEAIAKQLLEEMGKHDKFNGYSVAENKAFYSAPGTT